MQSFQKKVVTPIFVYMIFISILNANECKVTVGYVDVLLDKGVTHYANFTIYENDTLPVFQKQMRDVLNRGDYDVEIQYEDINGSHTKRVKKRKSFMVVGELKRITCIGVKNVERDKTPSTVTSTNNYP